MTTASSTFSATTLNRILNVSRYFLMGAFALSLFIALHPDARTSVRSSILKDYRKIVSTAKGDLLGDGTQLTVAKIKTRDALLLEVYESKDDGSQRLLTRIEIQDKKDGYFNFNGHATNLAIDDIDSDGRPEILAPSFDQNLVGRLNIYRYDQTAGIFQRSMR